MLRSAPHFSQLPLTMLYNLPLSLSFPCIVTTLSSPFPPPIFSRAQGWMPGEMDAGRVIEPTYVDSADPNAAFASANSIGIPPPPRYDGPPASDQPDSTITDALNERREQDAAGVTAESQASWRDSTDTERRGSVGEESLRRGSGTIEDGTAHLARLRQLKEEKEKRESPASPSPAPPTIEEERLER
jgi:hypothetical protein